MSILATRGCCWCHCDMTVVSPMHVWSIESLQCLYQVWWSSDLWFKSYSSKCVWCQFSSVLACLDWNILTETGCIVTESHFPLFCEDPVSHPVFIQTKKSHWFQVAWHPNSMTCKFITSLSLPPCNIMTGLQCVGTMRHLLAHTLREAAMKLGWNTTRMRGGVTVTY